MGLVAHAHEGGELFALGAGGNHHDFVGRIFFNVFDGHDVAHVHEVEVFDDFDVGLHAAAFDNHFLAVAAGAV